jgi:uncharacterized membrane protein
MEIVMFVYSFLLFFVLTPGILLSLPPKGSKIVVALTHAFVFALVLYLTCKIVMRSSKKLFEGMSTPIYEAYGCDKDKDKDKNM